MNEHPVWLVTGASKGIGLEVVKAALASGARVAATTRSPEKLSAELRDPNLLALAVDLTDERDVRRAVAQVETEFGRIDVLVNNAGYSLLAPSRSLPRGCARQLRRQRLRPADGDAGRPAGDARSPLRPHPSTSRRSPRASPGPPRGSTAPPRPRC